MNLNGLEKQIGKIERAAACAACDLTKHHLRRVDALIAEVAAERPEESGGELARYTSRSFCAWCGRVEVREYEATAEAAADLETFWRGIDGGRVCAPEVSAAIERVTARAREWFGERVGEYDAIYDEFVAEIRRQPPPRFPYVCAVEGCRCRHPKGVARRVA